MAEARATAEAFGSPPGGAAQARGQRALWRRIPADRWLVLLPLAFLGLFFLYPFAAMVRTTFGGDSFFGAYSAALSDPSFLPAVTRTLIVSFVSTFICLVLGYAIAYEVTRRSTRVRIAILAIVLVTFWISILIRAYSWVAILQPDGVLSKAFGFFGVSTEGWQLQGSTIAVTIGMVHFLLPYMVLVLIPPLRALDPALTRAAQSLGASRIRAFWRVTVPMTVGGVVAGCILTFILAIGFYVMPAILGGPANPFIANVVGEQVGRFQAFPVAGAMSVMLTVVVLCLYAAMLRIADPTKVLGGAGSR